MRGLALSGGGFRATLFHLGVVRYLYDAERACRSTNAESDHADTRCDFLTGIKYITSVSGGSILAAHLVSNWERYTDLDHPEKFDEAAQEIISFIRRDIRGRIVRRLPLNMFPYSLTVVWRRIPWLKNKDIPKSLNRSTSDSLERYYSKFLFKHGTLKGLKSQNGTRPDLFLMTTNLGGENAYAEFNSEGLRTFDLANAGGDTVPLARAVAASSAFPGMFTPVRHFASNDDDVEFKLSDGGIFDNLGIRKFAELLKSSAAEGNPIREVYVSDASVEPKRNFGLEFLEPVTIPLRAADILMSRVYDLEIESAKELRKQAHNCEFRFFRLRHEFSDGADSSRIPQDYSSKLASVRTDLDRFSDLEIAALVRHGYSVAKDSLPLPANPNAAQLAESWDPVSASTDRLAKGLFVDNSKIAQKIVRHLNGSSKRKMRLISFSDPISYATVGFPLILVTAVLAFMANSSFVRVSNSELVSLMPTDFNGKYALVLRTASSLSDVQSDDSTAAKYGQRAVFQTVSKVDSATGGDNTTYYLAAIADTSDAANTYVATATKNGAKESAQILPFSEFCPNPKLDPVQLYYVCENSQSAAAAPNTSPPESETVADAVNDTKTVAELENIGHRAILARDFDKASRAFDLAYKKQPTFHNVDEIRGLLTAKKAELTSGDPAVSEYAWRNLSALIATKYSWGMAPDLRNAFSRAGR